MISGEAKFMKRSWEVKAGGQAAITTACKDIEAAMAYLDFWYSEDGKYYEKLGSGSTAGLATEGTMYMSFTGTYIGMFSENAEGHFRNFSVKINKN